MPHTAGSRVGGDELVEDPLEDAEDDVGAVGDVDVLVAPLDDVAGQVGQGGVHGRGAELGDEQRPRAGR